MDEIVDIRSVGDVCRLCLSMDEPKSSVFGDQASTVSLATKIQAYLSIEILASDRLSTSICSECLKKVNKWHAYKEYCLRSQQKLQQCLGDQTENLGNIKVEPMDYYEPASPFETVPLTSDDESESITERLDEPAVPTISVTPDKNADVNVITMIKREPLDSEDPVTAENESIGCRELLLNPMAVAGHKDDRLMEADSTEKVLETKRLRGMKKKIRRGPHTHYRGKGRQFKQKCAHCQINLHSKSTYARHMERFHSGNVYQRKTRGAQKKMIPRVDNGTVKIDVNEDNNDETLEEMIEDVEDELISLEKDAPLTPVQQNIISQLKTFSCYSCKQYFNDRRSTLNHIRQHMPDLRPYTCIACLTEFADRSIYKLHCGASFQCAMKIALVIPEHGTEKYFTCNMCLRSLPDRRELLSHLSKHSDKQYEQLIAKPYRSPPKLKPITPLSGNKKNTTDIKVSRITSIDRRIYGPHNNGDPASNHACNYCNMIYQRKPNMLKHMLLCKKLSPDARICYKCIECGKTFLAFNKFQTHTTVEHRRKEIACFHCNTRYKKPSDFLIHYRQHFNENNAINAGNCDSERSSKVERWNVGDSHESNENDVFVENEIVATSSTKKSSTGICSSTNYTCVLCPKHNFPTQCHLTEHRRIHHPKLTIFSCSLCACTFGKASILEAHMADHEIGVLPAGINDQNITIPTILEDERDIATNKGPNDTRFSIKSDPGVSNTECHTCGKVFANYPNLRRHIRTVHDAIGRFSCFTCAKTFVREEQWRDHVENEHKSASATFNCPQCPETRETQEKLDEHRREVHGLNGEDHLACYICGKSFANETSLKIHRGHHFRVNSRLSIGNVRENEARDEKPRIPMTIVEASLRTSSNGNNVKPEIHVIPKSPRARKSFPNGSPSRQIKGNPLQCQVCDDRFNDVADLRKHLWDVHCARNKPEKTFISEKLQCELCTNVLPDEDSLKSHMKWHASNPILGNNEKRETTGTIDVPVECDLCGKFYSSIGNLRKHKKRHKAASAITLKLGSVVKNKMAAYKGFACNICRKVFAGRSTMMKHKSVAHTGSRNGASISVIGMMKNSSTSESVNAIKPIRPKLDFDTLANQGTFASLENDDSKKSIACILCRKILPNVRALAKHRQSVHKILIDDGATRNNINPYSTSETSVGISCTECKKLFTNVANMRQHYTKVHAVVNRGAQYRCSIDGCKLAFKTIIGRKNHEKTHSNLMYTCALCPRHMLSPTAMAEHMLTAHKTYSMANSKMALCKKIDLDSYVVKGAIGRQCPLCKINYPNHKALKIHYLKIHEGAA